MVITAPPSEHTPSLFPSCVGEKGCAETPFCLPEAPETRLRAQLGAGGDERTGAESRRGRSVLTALCGVGQGSLMQAKLPDGAVFCALLMAPWKGGDEVVRVDID